MKSLLPLLLLALSAGSIAAAQHTHQLARADGSLIHYTLDAPQGESAGLLVLSQGSGCQPGAQNAALATVRASFAAYTTLIVEKAGITPNAAIAHGNLDCPPEFHARYTVSQRLEDYRAVLVDLRRDPAFADARTILFGGSEGGLAMAMLAASIEPDAAIIMSSATGMPFGDMVRSTVPPEGHPTIDAGFAAARQNPDSSELFAGSTYRFWADILDHTALEHMLATTTPFLVLQGGRDTSSPIEAARLTADAFATDSLCNLTYWEFPALDHGLSDPNGQSHLASITRLAAHWTEDPLPAC